MANVTNHMLRKKLAEVNRESRAGVRGISTASTQNLTNEEEPLYLQEKKIVKIAKNTLIAEDNTKALLLNPLPSVKYKCIGIANSQGNITLTQPFKAIIIGDGQEKNYCIGIHPDTVTDEFEIIIDCKDTKININNTFLSTQTKTRIENGVERKNE